MNKNIQTIKQSCMNTNNEHLAWTNEKRQFME